MGDEYSIETIHRNIAKRTLPADQSITDRPGDEINENNGQTPAPDSQVAIMNETMKMWNITPETYFSLAAQSYNAGYPNVGAFVIQKLMPWFKFAQAMEQKLGHPLDPQTLQVGTNGLSSLSFISTSPCLGSVLD